MLLIVTLPDEIEIEWQQQISRDFSKNAPTLRNSLILHLDKAFIFKNHVPS